MRRNYQIEHGRVTETDGQDAPILVYVAPDAAEQRYLVDTFQIDEHTLHSALDPDELARVEFEPSHAALIVKRPKNYSAEEQFLFRVNSMGLFLFKDRLIIVTMDEAALFSGKVFPSLVSLPDIVLRLIYNAITHFLDHLKIINMVAEEVEQKINQSMENRFLINLFSLEKSLVYYVNAIHGNGLIISKLKAMAGRLGFSPEGLEFLDDVGIETDQCYKLADIYSNVLSGLMDARASLVNNNLNLLMKTLNIITISLMVPTLVVSIFSMNVPIPLQHHPHIFWGILALSTASAAGVMVAFWRHRQL
jgi:magnesium transporter